MTNTNTTVSAVADTTNNAIEVTHTVVHDLFKRMFGSDSTTTARVLFIIGITVVLLLTVKAVKHISNWIIYKSHEKRNPFGMVTSQPKFITVTWLIVSAITFVIYFLAAGLILQELLRINLTTYLASASIIGLAISFGSQGLVQDIVAGLTLIFCDTMDVGDLVEIAGTATVSGRVEKIGLRFTVLTNFYNQRVMIPNRTIANVSRFPQGGMDAYGDVHMPVGADPKKAADVVEGIAKGMKEQFGSIIFGDPTVEPLEMRADGSVNYYRVHFKFWPGQSSLIENTFRARVVSALKTIDPNYSDWQVPVTYRATMPEKN